MITAEVVAPEQLNFDQVLDLQRSAFRELLAKAKMESVQTLGYYKWKYFTPFGGARVATIYQDNQLVAMNSMFPLRVRSGSDSMLVWQSCDTATHPSQRGKGHFIRCLKMLKDYLGNDEIFLGFPNKNSAPGFLKFGWTERTCISTWVRYVPRLLSKSRLPLESTEDRQKNGFFLIDRFSDEFNEFFEMIMQGGGPILERSVAYMNWRYFTNPDYEYSCFGYRKNGLIQGLIVLRTIEVENRKCALIMEHFGVTEKVERKLRHFAAVWADAEEVRFVLMLNNVTSHLEALCSGYIPVPMFMLPKRQCFMGAATSEKAQLIFDREWRLQIGDWDGF
jgi:hypothetical protein